MVNNFWLNEFNERQNFNIQQLPPQISPTRFANSRVSPTRQYTQRQIHNTIVPNIHPSHLTSIHEHYMHHQHHFPHTNSVVHRCYETNTMCGRPFHPWNCGCRG